MKNNWWKKATIYQIYPRSFQDTNGDGIGDIPGIIQRLDYLSFLGIDAIWLSPIYASPNKDNGYDISDYKSIDPVYGTMTDMESLIKTAHKKKIKIIMDLVVNHTSNEHQWFKSAIKNPESKYHDFYIWRKGSNKIPPNTLQSNFGGSAWTFVPEIQEYYFHLHAKEQPDLNWENPNLRKEIYRMMNFWIDKGIGGFRLDVIDLIGKEPDQLITKNGPKLHELIQEMNHNTFGKLDLATVGETWGATPEIAQLYSGENRDELSMVFQFEHINLDKQIGKRKWDLKKLDPQEMHQVFSKWQIALANKGWNSLFWNNHDLPRIISRWGDDQKYRVLSGKMLAIYLYFLQGTPFIYQGEEIGMINYPIKSIDEVDDIESRRMYDERIQLGYTKTEIIESINKKGRDNGRHPMLWDSSEEAGFTKGTPWLPTGDTNEINVSSALDNKNSIFYTYKTLIKYRKNLPVITKGTFENISTGNPKILAYVRKYEKESLLVVVNFSDQSNQLFLEKMYKVKEVLIHNYDKELNQHLLPYESYAVLLEQ